MTASRDSDAVSLPAEGMAVSGHEDVRWGWWLALIVGLGAGLRIYHLGAESIWFDEGVILYLGKYLSDPLMYLNPEFCNDAPLHVVISALWYAGVLALPGVEKGSALCDVLLRLYPCMTGVASIVLVFVAARMVTGRARPALLAAFLFAISPFQIYYDQDLRAYALHVLINLCALCLVVKAIDTNRPVYWVALAFTLAAGIYNHFFMVWNIVAFNVFFVAALPWHWRRILHWGACNLAVILLATPALGMALYVSLVFDTAWETWYPFPGARLGLITFKNFFAGYSESATAYKALTVVCGGLTVAGVWSMRKKATPQLILLLALGVGPIAMSILYWSTKDFPYYTHRLMIFSAVPFYILVAVGLTTLRRGWLIAAGVGVVTLLTLPALGDYYAQRLHPVQEHTIGILYKADNRSAANFVRARWEPGDVVAHRVRYTYMPFKYYLGDDAPQKVVELTPQGIVKAMIGYPSIRGYDNYGTRPVLVSDVMASTERLWVVKSWWEPFNPEAGTEALTAWMDAHAVRELRQGFDGLSVYLYRILEGRSHDFLRATIYDDGDVRVPLYTARDSLATPQSLDDLAHTLAARRKEDADLRLSFDLVFGESGRDAGLNAVAARRLPSGESARVWSSFPRRVEHEAAFAFTVENDSAIDVDLDLRFYRSAATFFAPDFAPVDGNSSLWTYLFRYPMTPNTPVANRLALVAELNVYTPEGKAVIAETELAPGDYRVAMRCKVAQLEVNEDGAHAEVSVLDGGRSESELVGTVVPIDASTPSGWRWLPVGDFHTQGGPVQLRVAAFNRDGLDSAEIHFDRLVITPVEHPEFETHGQRLRVAAGTSTRVESSTAIVWPGATRIDIEAYDGVAGVYRNLAFHSRRDIAPRRVED